MNAPNPATRPALAFKQFLNSSFNTALSGFNLFGIFHPTDKLIAREQRNIFPSSMGFIAGKKRLSQIRWHFMRYAS
jgi:hypothetical protein